MHHWYKFGTNYFNAYFTSAINLALCTYFHQYRQELCTYAVDSSSKALLGPLHFSWDVDEHRQGENESDN
jgi:hypothetical protein